MSASAKAQQPPTRPAPLGLAISLAFLLSFLFSPGQQLLAALVGVPALQSMAAGERSLALAMAGYWLPTALFYIALRLIPAAAALKATRWDAFALGLGNAVLILYVALRLFASTVAGGGASALVGTFAGVTAMPALMVIGGVVLKVVVQAFARREKASNPASAWSRPGVPAAAAMVLLGFAPPVCAIGGLFVGL